MPDKDWTRDWDRVQSVFLSVADLLPQDQARALDATCADDRELRAEVQSLLESDRQGGHIISSGIASEAAQLFSAQELIGNRLGAYRVVQEIGRGGMGDVYLAIRDDDEFQKQVAIKVVRRGMDTADVLDRFRHERQILANLDHPYIARLLDGGTTPDGRPFFVMDYVEGQPLEAFCKEQNSGIKDRCRLFLKILEAVSHAHRNLVVHRDLKPGNIVVTRDGNPKLLDFGVAKLLEQNAAGVTAASLARPFTPEYASPEQVMGLPVATTSDIYSLGAVFYELLTGQRAQIIAPLTPTAVERVVCNTEVLRPSFAAPAVDSDLDNIVLMAMRKEPRRRYQSVDQFADDIQRYLSGRTVLARQDSFAYRARKFAGRNRFKIAAVALVFASLVAALTISIAQSHQAQAARNASEAQRAVAEQERAIAQSEFQRAEAARSNESLERQNANQQRDVAVVERARAEQRLTQLFALADRTLFDVHDAVAKLPGATEARRGLVRTTLDYLENIEKEHGLDDRMRLELGSGYTKIAEIQGDPMMPSLGDFEGARASYQKAEALLTPLLARNQNDAGFLMRWIELESDYARLLATRFTMMEGVEKCLKLIPVAHHLGEIAPNDPNALKQEATLHGQVSQSLQGTNQAEAWKHAALHIELITPLVARFPNDRDLSQELGVALASAAVSRKDIGDFTGAADYFDRSIRIREQYLAADPNNLTVQRNLLVAYGNYAALLGIKWSPNLGRFAEAREYCEKSVVLARKMSASDPQDQTARFDLGMSLGQLGMVEPDDAHLADSMKSIDESLTILDPVRKANPNSVTVVSRVALLREYAGYRLRRMGRIEEAAEQFREALAELEPLLMAPDPNPGAIPGALDSEEGLAEIYALQGDRDKALEYGQHAVARAEQYSRTHPNKDVPRGHLANAYSKLAVVKRAVGDRAGAAQAAAHAMSLWVTITNPAILSVHRDGRAQVQALLHEIEK